MNLTSSIDHLSVKLTSLGKRKTHAGSREVIIISDDDDDKKSSLTQIVSKKSKSSDGKRHITSSTSSMLIDLTLSSESETESKLVEKPEPALSSHLSLSTTLQRRDRSGEQCSKLPSRSCNPIKITAKTSVEEIISLDHIPSLWDVPQHETGYLIDLSTSSDFREKSLIQWIRHDEQSSWDGTSGHQAGDAKVVGLFGAVSEEFVCRRADFHCQGIKKCEFLDPSLLDGFESWERNDPESKQFWQLELERNEQEFCDPDGPLARFYRRVIDSKCKVKCQGKPVLCKLRKKSLYGKTSFIGCDKWCKDDGEGAHRSLNIDPGLDEELVAEMLINGGTLPREQDKTARLANDKCCLVLPPRSHKIECPFTHIINGKIKRGRIQPHKPKCGARLIIFEPVDRSIRKALVIPQAMKPHNHPRPPHIKPTLAEKKFVGEACKASGELIISAKTLRTSATTRSLLQGKSWESHVPGMVDSRRLTKYLKTINFENFPKGLDWEGKLNLLITCVQHEAEKDAKLAPKDRYIHTVTTKGEIRLVVTMNPQIIEFIHKVRFLAIDYTFKRVRGEMNEWEVAGTIDRYKKRVTFASLYCNKANRDAFYILFQEFFDVIRRLTGKKLSFSQMDPTASLGALLFDAEAAQMQGCGDILLQMNNAEISKISTTDPLVLVQYFSKTCVQHFYRNIDALPKHISRDTIERLKSFPGLSSSEDIASWHKFCKSSKYKDVTNWYAQKISHPWYLPSVNRFLSPMPKNIWDIVPNDTNIAETAHAARNAETKINRPLLAAILDARFRDQQIAGQFKYFEDNYTTTDRYNLPINREKRSAARRQFSERKTKNINAARADYEGLKTQIAKLDQMRKESFGRRDKIKAALDDLKIKLNACSKVSMEFKDLTGERKRLEHELQEEVKSRKAWQLEKSQLKKKLEEIKAEDLSGSRVRHSRPSSSASSPRNSDDSDDDLPMPKANLVLHSNGLDSSNSLVSEDFLTLSDSIHSLVDTVPPPASDSDFISDPEDALSHAAKLDIESDEEVDISPDIEDPLAWIHDEYSLAEHETHDGKDFLDMDAISNAIFDRFFELYPEDI